MYEADNRPFKKMRTLKGAFFLPSYINCTSYIVPSYIKILRTFAPQSAHWGPRGFSILGESGGIGCPFIKRSGINPCTPIVERDVYLCTRKDY